MTGNPRQYSPALLVIVIALLTLAVFWPVVRFEFTTWDDYQTIAQNPKLNPVTAQTFLSFWKHPQMDLYIPMTYTAWSMVAALTAPSTAEASGAGLNPHVFHALNLVLHVLSAAVVFAILRMLVRSNLPAMLGALLFAVHPVQVESVAWASGTKDVLFGLFSLIAIWQYLYFSRETMEAEAPRLARDRTTRVEIIEAGEDAHPAARRIHYAIALIAFALALLSKPTAIVVPFILGVIDYFLIGRPIHKILLALAPWLVMTIPAIIWTHDAQPAIAAHEAALPIYARPLVAADALAFYFYKLIWPAKLAFDYGRATDVIVQRKWIYWTWVIPAGVAAALFVNRRRAMPLVVASIVFVLSLGPVLGFVPFDFQAYSTVADHYLYLPMLGVALAAAWALTRWKQPAALTIAAAIIVALGARSFAQTSHWRDTHALMQHELAVNPDSFAAYTNLGAVAYVKEDAQASINYATKAISIRPSYSHAYRTLGMALKLKGDLNGASDAFAKTLKLNPGDTVAMANLAAALSERGHLADAAEWAAKAARLDPDDPSAHINLGTIYGNLGRADDAMTEFRKALDLAPNNKIAHTNLGLLLLFAGQNDAAAFHFRQALQVDPSFVPAQRGLAALKQTNSVGPAP